MNHSYIDKYSECESLIHKIDPRVKALVFIGFMLFVIFTPPSSAFAFFLYAGLLFLLIYLSKLPIGFVFLRSLTILPFVVMIAFFIPFMEEKNVYGVSNLTFFKFILIKSYLCMLCMILLTSTTKFVVLLKALEKLKMPSVMVMILSFMYRYIFVVTDELMEMKRAKNARTVGGSSWFHLKALSNMVGVLFLRSYEKGEAVYMAMCARGFKGEIKTLDQLRVGKLDILFLFFVGSVLCCIRLCVG